MLRFILIAVLLTGHCQLLAQHDTVTYHLGSTKAYALPGWALLYAQQHSMDFRVLPGSRVLINSTKPTFLLLDSANHELSRLELPSAASQDARNLNLQGDTIVYQPLMIFSNAYCDEHHHKQVAVRLLLRQNKLSFLDCKLRDDDYLNKKRVNWAYSMGSFAIRIKDHTDVGGRASKKRITCYINKDIVLVAGNGAGMHDFVFEQVANSLYVLSKSAGKLYVIHDNVIASIVSLNIQGLTANSWVKMSYSTRLQELYVLARSSLSEKQTAYVLDNGKIEPSKLELPKQPVMQIAFSDQYVYIQVKITEEDGSKAYALYRRKIAQ